MGRLDDNLNGFRDDWRIMGDVPVIAEDQLKGVRSRWKFKDGFRLSPTEMSVLVVGRDRDPGVRKRRINDQMVMACVGFLDGCGSDAGAREPESHDKGALNDRPLGRRNDIQRSAFRGGCSARGRLVFGGFALRLVVSRQRRSGGGRDEDREPEDHGNGRSGHSV